MKRLLCALSVALLLIENGNIYSQSLKVAEIQKENDLVIFETSTGYRFNYKGIEDIQPGEIYSVIFWNNATENIQDDSILSIRFSGFSVEEKKGEK